MVSLSLFADSLVRLAIAASDLRSRASLRCAELVFFSAAIQPGAESNSEPSSVPASSTRVLPSWRPSLTTMI